MIFRAGFSYVLIYPLRSDILQYESSPEVVDAPENHHSSLPREVKIFFIGVCQDIQPGIGRGLPMKSSLDMGFRTVRIGALGRKGPSFPNQKMGDIVLSEFLFQQCADDP